MIEAYYEANMDLPFGRGRKFGTDMSGVANKLVSGWAINTIYTAQSGFPLGGPGCRANLTSSFGGGCRVNGTGQSAEVTGNAEGRINRWFDPGFPFWPWHGRSIHPRCPEDHVFSC